MLRIINRWLILGLWLVITYSMSLGQNKPKALLAKERAGLEGKIALINTLLKETSQKTQRSRNELTVLNQQIEYREKLVKALETEIEMLSDEIVMGEERFCYLQENLSVQRTAYGITAQKRYLNHPTQNFWLALLSSKSLTEVFYRILYFRQITNYQKQQILQIQRTETEIQKAIALNRQAIIEKEYFLQEKQNEANELSQSKSNQLSIYQELKSKETSYQSELNSHRVELSEILTALETQDAPASTPIVTNNEKSTTTPEKNNSSSKSPTSTSEGKDIHKQKGKLPWPVPSNRGVLIGKYGNVTDEHGNLYFNKGIEIRTPHGQEITAIYDGKVTAILKIPQSGTMVVVAHGDYRSVYGNLMDVQVQNHQTIKQGEAVGSVRVDTRTEEAILKFLFWKFPDNYLDPENWLGKE